MDTLQKDPFLDGVFRTHGETCFDSPAFTEKLVQKIARAQRRVALRQRILYTSTAILLAELLLWFLFPFMVSSLVTPIPTLPDNSVMAILWLLEWIGKVVTHPCFFTFALVVVAGVLITVADSDNCTFKIKRTEI